MQVFVAAGCSGLITTTALILPFDVGLSGMDTQWSLLARLQAALDIYTSQVLAAATLFGPAANANIVCFGSLALFPFLWRTPDEWQLGRSSSAPMTRCGGPDVST